MLKFSTLKAAASVTAALTTAKRVVQNEYYNQFGNIDPKSDNY